MMLLFTVTDLHVEKGYGEVIFLQTVYSHIVIPIWRKQILQDLFSPYDTDHIFVTSYKRI